MSISVLTLVAELIKGMPMRECAAALTNISSDHLRLLQNSIAAIGAVITLEQENLRLVSVDNVPGTISVPPKMIDPVSEKFGLFTPRGKTAYKIFADVDEHLVRIPFWWPSWRDFPVILHSTSVTTNLLVQPRHWCSRKFAEFIVPVFVNREGRVDVELLRLPHFLYTQAIAHKGAFFVYGGELESADDFNVGEKQIQNAQRMHEELSELMKSDLPGLGTAYALLIGKLLSSNVRYNPAPQKALLARTASA